MPSRNSRQRRRLRVRWDDCQERGEKFRGDVPQRLQWQCEADPGRERRLPIVCNFAGELPDAVLKLRSEDGDIFEVHTSLLKSSSIVCHLVEDGGVCEDIPLPGVRSRCLSFFLDICRGQPNTHLTIHQGVHDAASLLSGTLWVTKLLEMWHVVGCPLGKLIEDGVFGDRPFRGIPSDLLPLLLQYNEGSFSPSRLEELIEILTERVDGGQELQVVSAIKPQLNHKNEDVRTAALQGLSKMHTAEAQVVLLSHKDFGVRKEALRKLPRHSENAMNKVLELVDDCSFQVREATAEALAIVSPWGDALALDALVRLLEDPVHEVRKAAVAGVHSVAVPDEPTTVAMLMARTSHADWPVRCAAVQALIGVVKDNRDILREVAEQLKSSEYTPAKVLGARLLKDRDEEELHHDDPSVGLALAEEDASCDQGDSDAERHPRKFMFDDGLDSCFPYQISRSGVMALDRPTWADLVD